MQIMPAENRAGVPEDDGYPPEGTPETALVIVWSGEDYAFHIMAHTGRYFHGTVEVAGFNGEESGMEGVPEEPGFYVMENGRVSSHRDRETGIVEEVLIHGDWRKARLADFDRFGIECPLDLSPEAEEPGISP